MFTYYFLQDGEVMFIENFDDAQDAIEHRNKHFPRATLAVRVSNQDNDIDR